MATLYSREQIYQLFMLELQSQSVDITDDSEGSTVDILAGITAQLLTEVMKLTVDEYKKTFFNSADGPEVTGGPDDLETLAVDRYGDTFARPVAVPATGAVTFSRENDDAGPCTIPAGTVVATNKNANGVAQRFATLSEVSLDANDLTINAEVVAQEEGVVGNVAAGTVVNIESTLTDSSLTVTNASSMSGGADEENDAQYRETIRNKIKTLKGATMPAIKAAVEAVPGVAIATPIEKNIPVIEYDIAAGTIKDGATYFRLPFGHVYIADINGEASDALLAAANDAVYDVRATGVKIEVHAATAVSMNWSASITLSLSGPNYDALSEDGGLIEDAMAEYLKSLPIGTGFKKSVADAAMLAMWGSSGTGDITSFATTVPIGDVSIGEGEKLVPGTMGVS